MSLTVFKYEWLRTRGPLGLLLAIAAAMVLFSSLLFWFNFPMLVTFGLLFATIATFGLLPLAQLYLAFDYWRASYSKTGYFTHTVPLPGGVIFRTKLVWQLLVSVVLLIPSAVFGLILVGGWNRSNGDPFNPFPFVEMLWNEAAAYIPTWMSVGFLLFMLYSVLLLSVQYVFCCSIGAEGRWQSLGGGGPIVIYLILYGVMQVVTVIAIFAIPLGVNMTPGQIGFEVAPVTELFNDPYAEIVPIGFIPVFLIAAPLLIWRTNVSWTKKTQLV